MDKVSVVIPVYNGEKIIAKAIETVRAQTYPVHEIIVINDGSTDHTEDVLKSFGDKIRYKTMPNGRCAKARNAAIAMSTGDWIALLDADDIWYPAKLEKQMAVVAAFPEVKFVCTNFDFLDRDTQQMRDHLSVRSLAVRGMVCDRPIPDPLPILLQANFIGVSGVLFNKDFFYKVGEFSPLFYQVEDYQFWLRCAVLSPFVAIRECLFEKVSDGRNMSSNWIENCQWHNKAVQMFVDQERALLTKKGWLSLAQLKLAWGDYQIGDRYCMNGDRRNAWKYYFSGLRRSLSLGNVLNFFIIVSKRLIRGSFFKPGQTR